MDLFDLFAKISLDTSEYDTGLEDASRRTSTAFDGLQKAGQGLSSIGGTLTENVSKPILQFGQYTLETASNFQAGMSEVQAISGATGTEMEQLKQTGLDMAAQTKFSTAEVAEAYKYMGMAGWDAIQMGEGLAGVMYLAGASGEDLATTSDIVTDAITAFGMQAGESGRFADVLAAASANANTNVGLMGDSFQYVAPIAGAMGYSIEDVAIALGLMANNGIKGSSAGAQLRNIITNLANPTDTMAAAMQTLGVRLDDGAGYTYSFMEVMEQLRAGFGGGAMDSQEFASAMSELQESLESGEITAEEYETAVGDLAVAMYGAEGAQKAQLAASLAGKESMAGLLAIVNTAPGEFDSLTSSVYNSNGAAMDMYNVMNDNANGAVTRLFSAIDVLAESLGEFLIPAFTQAVEWITQVVNWFNSLDDGTKQVILGILGVVAVVGPLLSGLGSIMSGISAVSSVVSLLGGAFTFLTSPIGLVIAGITALGGALVWAYNTFEGFRNFVNGIGEAISGFWDRITGKQDESLEHMETSMTTANANMEASTVKTWPNMENQIGNSLGAMVNIATTSTDSIEKSVDSSWQSASSSTAQNWGSMEGQVVGSLEVMSNTTAGSMSGMSGDIDAAWLQANGSTVQNWTGMEGQVVGSLDAMSTTTAGSTGDIYSAINTAWTDSATSTDRNWEQMVSTTDSMSGQAVTAVDRNFGKMEGAVVGNLKDARAAAGRVEFSGVGVGIVDGMSSGVRSRAAELAGSVVSAAQNALQAAKNALAINSPSKKFRDIIGVGIGEGMAVGVDQSQGMVVASIYDMADKIETAFDGSLGDLQLGITPARISAYAAPTPYGSPQQGFPGVGDTIVNIYSPKAVDAVEAAREWKKTTQRLAMAF